MSNQALTWAYAQHTGKGVACKAVLVALADMADERHSCWPSQALLAERTEQSERNVRTHLGYLEDQGFLKRQPWFAKNGQRANDRYVLAVSVEATRIIPKVTPIHRNEEPPEARSAGSTFLQPPEAGSETTGTTFRGTLIEPSVEPSVPKAAPRRNAKEEFAQFWEIYPRREARGAAESKFTAARKKVDLETLLVGAARYRDDPNREDQYTKQASSWLYKECWTDEPLPQRSDRQPAAKPEFIERREQREQDALHRQAATGALR